jgi:hypothetical protein
MDGTTQPMGNIVGAKKPLSGCWFWGLAVGGVAIILAAVIHDKLSHYTPAKQAEAKTNLGAVFTTQVAYYGEFNTYAGGKRCFENISWVPDIPREDTKYNYYCGDEVIFCTQPGCDRCLNTKLPGGGANKQGGVHDANALKKNGASVHSETKILDGARSSRKGFTVYAVGNVDRDSACDVWSIHDQKELINSYNDLGD